MTFVQGLLDATRLAIVDADVWSEMLLANRENVLQVIDGLSGNLEQLRSALRAGNAADVRTWLQRGVEWREKYR
jgi:prephenate dehydrogenase